ncbi:MAG: hypothetical protein ACHQ7N_08375 [Candidatus Methylomirabilales bacterium]
MRKRLGESALAVALAPPPELAAAPGPAAVPAEEIPPAPVEEAPPTAPDPPADSALAPDVLKRVERLVRNAFLAERIQEEKKNVLARQSLAAALESADRRRREIQGLEAQHGATIRALLDADWYALFAKTPDAIVELERKVLPHAREISLIMRSVTGVCQWALAEANHLEPNRRDDQVSRILWELGKTGSAVSSIQFHLRQLQIGLENLEDELTALGYGALTSAAGREEVPA